MDTNSDLLRNQKCNGDDSREADSVPAPVTDLNLSEWELSQFHTFKATLNVKIKT